MNQILEMREKRAQLWDAAKKFLDEHQDTNNSLSAEDAATYDRMEADVVSMGQNIERLERQAAIDREMNSATSTVLASRPGKPEGGKTGRASDEYKQAFWAAIRGHGSRAALRNALQVDTDSEGGFLVPDEYERTLVKSLEDANIMRTLCTNIRTDSGERKIPVVASTGTGSWVEEEGDIPESDDTFGQITLSAHKVATMIKVSDELLRDSVFDIQSYIAGEFARRIGACEEGAFITGDGTHKPTGLLHATNGAGVGVTTAGATFTADEVIDLVYSVRSVYRPNAVFLMNDSAIRALRKLKDGSGQYLWQPGLREGEPDRLLNHRVYTSAYMPEIAAGNKPILFGDFKSYWIADRDGRSFQRLNELYAKTGQVGFLATERVDGRLVLPEAMKCLQIKTA